MAAPDTSTTLAKLGYDGYRNTTLCNRFDNTYREWTTKTLAKRYGPLSISEEVFTQLLQDIRANGIHRTDEARHLAYHTLLINRAIGILKHLLRKEVKDAHERYLESERVTRQPTNRSEGSAERKALENEVLHIAYALLSDSFNSRSGVSTATRTSAERKPRCFPAAARARCPASRQRSARPSSRLPRGPSGRATAEVINKGGVEVHLRRRDVEVPCDDGLDACLY